MGAAWSSARLAEFPERLGQDDPGLQAVRRSAARLAAVVSEVESVLSEAVSAPENTENASQ
jgi:hypothetical protein